MRFIPFVVSTRQDVMKCSRTDNKNVLEIQYNYILVAGCFLLKIKLVICYKCHIFIVFELFLLLIVNKILKMAKTRKYPSRIVVLLSSYKPIY